VSNRLAWERVRTTLEREGLLSSPMPEVGAPTGIATDSRKVQPGELFLAVPGTQLDGHAFVADAVRHGAALALVERPLEATVPQIVVRDARRASSLVARAWFDNPAEAMVLVGVTGTNGKTTTTGITRHLLNRAGDAGLIGTLGAVDGSGVAVPTAALTTPGPVDLHATFRRLADRGVTQVVMETSSHSLHQGRLEGLGFAGAVFTNLTREHLDYHLTMEEYLEAKLLLLALLRQDAVVAVNADDPAWEVILRRPGTLRFGLAPEADLRAEGLVASAAGSRFQLTGRFGTREVELPLSGDFNIANALGAAAIALGLGRPLQEVAERLSSAPQVPGRMERLAARPCVILRDYAHTPDALQRVLATLRPLTRGRLMVLFGCGGDRDRGKRPLMGRMAAEGADVTFLAPDNPRTEDPDQIIDDILVGMPGQPVHRFSDRREAIGVAIAMASEGDTLLLAGKGHETYQIVGDVKFPFDERAIVEELTQ
jgi:UDP-N-acetylmuramoyl-L-alanyl-D-glutamate--2,6-diaminopimelate ligase